MSRTPPPPRHGTEARYRLERKAVAAGKLLTACDRCKSAHAAAEKDRRANRKAAGLRAGMKLVGGTQSGVHIEDTPTAETEPAPDADDKTGDRTPGGMEAALKKDLTDLADSGSIPFFESLKVLALQLARDVDSAELGPARTAARKQLVDLIRLLRPGGEPDDPQALADALGFGSPLVP